MKWYEIHNGYKTSIENSIQSKNISNDVFKFETMYIEKLNTYLKDLRKAKSKTERAVLNDVIKSEWKFFYSLYKKFVRFVENETNLTGSDDFIFTMIANEKTVLTLMSKIVK